MSCTLMRIFTLIIYCIIYVCKYYISHLRQNTMVPYYNYCHFVIQHSPKLQSGIICQLCFSLYLTKHYELTHLPQLLPPLISTKQFTMLLSFHDLLSRHFLIFVDGFLGDAYTSVVNRDCFLLFNFFVNCRQERAYVQRYKPKMQNLQEQD